MHSVDRTQNLWILNLVVRKVITGLYVKSVGSFVCVKKPRKKQLSVQLLLYAFLCQEHSQIEQKLPNSTPFYDKLLFDVHIQ